MRVRSGYYEHMTNLLDLDMGIRCQVAMVLRVLAWLSGECEL